MELLTLLATACCLLLAAVALRRSTRRAHARRTLHRVRDAAVAHRALNKNADAFLDRAEGFFPVVLGTGLRRGERNETIVTASHGPHWRALRCNLSADVLHPSRVASLAPLQQEAAQALVAGLFAKVQGEAASVVIRGDLNRAAFSLLARMCFGDGVDGHCVESMEREMLDLLATVGELIPVVDGSWLPQLLYRRQLTHLMGALGRQKLMYLPLIDARRRPESRVYRGGGVAYPYVDSLLDLRVPNGEGGGRSGTTSSCASYPSSSAAARAPPWPAWNGPWPTSSTDRRSRTSCGARLTAPTEARSPSRAFAAACRT